MQSRDDAGPWTVRLWDRPGSEAEIHAPLDDAPAEYVKAHVSLSAGGVAYVVVTNAPGGESCHRVACETVWVLADGGSPPERMVLSTTGCTAQQIAFELELWDALADAAELVAEGDTDGAIRCLMHTALKVAENGGGIRPPRERCAELLALAAADRETTPIHVH